MSLVFKATTDAARDAGPEPLVSVIIPAYKVAAFIRETLDSVLGQTFADYEIVVVNDGSPDTEELEKELETYGNGVIYIKQSNQGAGAARNAGIRVARGKFIAFLDGDDVWLPQFLSEQLELIDSDGGYDLVYADAVNFNGPRLTRLTNMDLNASDGHVTMESLISERCNVITSSVVARRNSIVEAGLFDESFPNSQDFDLWLRLAKQGARMTYQKRVLVHRRIYQGSLASDPMKSYEGQIKVLEKTERRNDLTIEERAALRRSLEVCRARVAVLQGKRSLSQGDFTSAVAAFGVANKHFQGWKLWLVMFWLRIAPHTLQRVYKLRAD